VGAATTVTGRFNFIIQICGNSVIVYRGARNAFEGYNEGTKYDFRTYQRLSITVRLLWTGFTGIYRYGTDHSPPANLVRMCVSARARVVPNVFRFRFFAYVRTVMICSETDVRRLSSNTRSDNSRVRNYYSNNAV